MWGKKKGEATDRRARDIGCRDREGHVNHRTVFVVPEEGLCLLSSLRSTILSVGGYDSICPPPPIISCSIDDAVSSSPVVEGYKVLPSRGTLSFDQ